MARVDVDLHTVKGYSQHRMSHYMDISTKTLSDWISAGIVKRTGGGVITPVAALRDMAIFIKKVHRHEENPPDEASAKVRKLLADAETKELQLDVYKGKLLPVEEISFALSGIVSVARQNLLGLHSSIKARHPDVHPDILLDIQEMITDTLNDLAETDTKAIIADSGYSEESVDATTEIEPNRVGEEAHLL